MKNDNRKPFTEIEQIYKPATKEEIVATLKEMQGDCFTLDTDGPFVSAEKYLEEQVRSLKRYLGEASFEGFLLADKNVVDLYDMVSDDPWWEQDVWFVMVANGGKLYIAFFDEWGMTGVGEVKKEDLIDIANQSREVMLT